MTTSNTSDAHERTATSSAPARRTSVRWGDPPDARFLDDVVALFARNGREKPVELLQWQYLDGVAGPAAAVALERDGRLGALYVTVPRRVQVDGRAVTGAQSLDVMTDDDWRGRGLYLRLAADCYRALERTGTRLVFGVPNAGAAPGFTGTLGWEPLGTMPFLVRPLPGAAVARRSGVSWTPPERMLPGVIACSDLPGGLDALWRRFARTLRVAVVRDEAFLRWRLLERPGSDYRLYAAYSKGRLVAFGAVTVLDRHSARIGYVMELLADPAHPRAASRLLRQLARHAASEGADLLLAWNPRRAPTRPLFTRAGFIPLPDAARPIELHFGARVFDRRDTGMLACLLPDAWYLSYLDSDTI